MAPTQKPVGQAETQDMSQKKPRLPSIRWCEADVKAIVTWIGHRDERGKAVNYEAWTTGNHTYAAARMLVETGLGGKDRVTKKKAADKLGDMIKSYKNMRETADRTGWGTEETKHKEQELGWDSTLTVKDHILKKCPWFYDFEDLFHKHPGTNPPLIIESRKPPKRNGAAVEEDDLGGYGFDLDQDLENPRQPATREAEEEEEDMSASSSNLSDLSSDSDSGFRSALHDARRESRKKANKVPTPKKAEDGNSNHTLLSDDEEENKAIRSVQARTSSSTRLSYLQSKSRKALTNTNRERLLTPGLSTSSKPLVQNRNPLLPSNNRTSKRKHHSDSNVLLDFVEDAQGFRAKKRSENSKRSMTEAMAEETKLDHIRLTEKAKIDEEQAKKDRKERREQAEYDRRQRDQHHAMEMARQQAILNQGELMILQSRERILRLQLNLQRQAAASKNPAVGASLGNLEGE